MAAAIGAVGQDIAGTVRQSVRIGLAIVDIGRSDRDLLDQGGVGVSAHVSLAAVDGQFPLGLTQCESPPSALAEATMVASTSVPVFTRIAFALS